MWVVDPDARVGGCLICGAPHTACTGSTPATIYGPVDVVVKGEGIVGKLYAAERVVEDGIQTYVPGQPITEAEAKRLGVKTTDSPHAAVMGNAEPEEEEALYVGDGSGAGYPGSGPDDGVTDPRADVAPTEHAKAGVLDQHAEIIKKDIKDAENYPADLGPVTSSVQKSALDATGEKVDAKDNTAADVTGDDENLSELTKVRLQERLDAAGVEYDSRANKSELIEALEKASR